MPLQFQIAQLNYTVGDIAGNVQKIAAAAEMAHHSGAQVLLTSELSICGYAAEDLLLRPSFIAACHAGVQDLVARSVQWPGLYVVVGHPKSIDAAGDERTKSVSKPRRYNAASVVHNGRVIETYAKRELPNYQVFDERRYFTPGQGTGVFQVGDVSVGLLICEDAWFEEPAQLACEAGAQVLAVLNASPYHAGKEGERIDRMAARAKACGRPLIYAHMVGGQDEVVFDGQSFAVAADGTVCAQAQAFCEELLAVEATVRADGSVQLSGSLAPQPSPNELLWRALVLGVRDYVTKNGFPSAILGLSGGIDSALVLAIAVDALGADKLHAVMMPSPYTAEISKNDAADMAQRLGVRYDTIAITPQFNAFKAALAAQFAGLPEDTTEENLQARIRGTLLMALSNKSRGIVLTTGNKSEMATGYCTLYGDMAGGFAVIKDLVKTKVYELARWRNDHDVFGTGACPIPERIITRAPSAELKDNQTDQDSLPPYEVLDAILERYMENDESVAQILAAGFAAADVKRVVGLIKINEYKRRQAPVGIRLTHRSFGKDWRYPITSKFSETAQL